MNRLDADTRMRLLPLFDLVAVPSTATTEKDVEKHVIKCAETLLSACSEGDVCYVDLFDVNLSARLTGGQHPKVFVLNHAHAANVAAIPVVGFDRDVQYQLAVREVVDSGSAPGLAIRLQPEDIALSRGLRGRVNDLVVGLGARDLALHVLIDLRAILPRDIPSLRGAVMEALREVQQVRPERIVLAASCMPNSLASIKTKSTGRIGRHEFDLWRDVAATSNHPLAFGDYGVVHPDYVDLDPRMIQPAAKIRYATPTDWVVIKGHSWRDDTRQHRLLSQKLIQMPDFRGADCWGSYYIEECARSSGGSVGNLETWVSVDQNVHMSIVPVQVDSAVKALTRVGGEQKA